MFTNFLFFLCVIALLLAFKTFRITRICEKREREREREGGGRRRSKGGGRGRERDKQRLRGNGRKGGFRSGVWAKTRDYV